MVVARGGSATTSGRTWAQACFGARSAEDHAHQHAALRNSRSAANTSFGSRHVQLTDADSRNRLHKQLDVRLLAVRHPGGRQQRCRNPASVTTCNAAHAGRLGGTWQLEKPAPGIQIIRPHPAITCLRNTCPQRPERRWRRLVQRGGSGWWGRVPLLGSTQLLQRIGLTIAFLALARLGMFIPLPGVGLVESAGPALAKLCRPMSALHTSHPLA